MVGLVERFIATLKVSCSDPGLEYEDVPESTLMGT